ncbi:transcriptional regulator family: Fungal Specific TF [Paecilomyces variotii]|nr:transcriptional regulator family: Fungal Specific TF [Paecilomyces variotii]
MSSPQSGAGELPPRRRRAHTKSRRGCRNCKLRRVKCDEGEPSCQKCLLFRVACNYNAPDVPDLQPASHARPGCTSSQTNYGQIVLDMKPNLTSLRPVVTIGNKHSSFNLDLESVSRLDKFRHRTAFTFATASNLESYQNDVVQLALENPFLMHAILTVTATHDRHLSMSPDNTRRSLAEAYHWSRCAALLNEKLSAPIRPQDRDPLWAAAAMLGILDISSIEASSPEEAWPLKSSDPSDLNWLSFAQGKHAVWKATNPLRPDSLFSKMADEYRILMTKPPLCEIKDIPPEFVRLCHLDQSVPLHQNPYYSAVSIVARLWDVPCTQASMIQYLKFLGFMEPAFRSFLHGKDPRALLITAFWYGPMCDSLWWIARRARLECQAICLYLERYHAEETEIQRMLERPKRQCWLAR